MRRGVDYEVLTAEIAQNIAERVPQVEWVEFSGCSLAPALMNDRQVAVVHEWLQRDVLAEEGKEAKAEEAWLDMDEKTQEDSYGDAHGAADGTGIPAVSPAVSLAWPGSADTTQYLYGTAAPGYRYRDRAISL